ncbi:hypothetical protein ACOME3_001693 [Neoechinorhynchus agilis]
MSYYQSNGNNDNSGYQRINEEVSRVRNYDINKFYDLTYKEIISQSQQNDEESGIGMDFGSFAREKANSELEKIDILSNHDSGYDGIRAWQERSFALYGDGGVMDNIFDFSENEDRKTIQRHHEPPVEQFKSTNFRQCTSQFNILDQDLNSENSVPVRPPLFDDLMFSDCRAGKPSPERASQVPRVQIVPFLETGGFGEGDNEFSEPNGIELTKDGKVIVVDTNKHQIKFFDLNGTFLYRFGMPGKALGKLLYPCKVALTPGTEDLVIIQRSPLPQVQIFDQKGGIRHRFGNDHLLVPRGVCVDEKGNIIVMESKVMRCHIFSTSGRHIRTMTLTNHLRFPYDICAAKGIIFIADNQAHCVKLFSYSGDYVGAIGEKVTKYPVSVKIVAGDKLLVADNHENFNVYLFSLHDGRHLQSFYSSIKHAQCYDIAVNDNMYLVMTTKDFRVYGYRLPPTPVIDQRESICSKLVGYSHERADRTVDYQRMFPQDWNLFKGLH